MNTKTSELYSIWPTHFIVRSLELPQVDNIDLANLCRAFVSSSMSSNGTNGYRRPADSIYAQESGALKRYALTVQNAAHAFLQLYGVAANEVDLMLDGFANVERQGQWATHHAHVSVDIVVTYYPFVFRAEGEHPRGGCMYYTSNDPKLSSWMLRKEQQMLEFKPETGTQLVFPGYVRHATNPLFVPGSEKVALVTNVKVVPKSAAGKRSFMTLAEINQVGT